MSALFCKKGELECLIAGAPNCGKTSLFNRLTSKKAYVGNREGVTVKEEYATATVGGRCVSFCDLPGVRSCGPDFAPDEEVTLRSVRYGGADGKILILAIPLGSYTAARQGATVASYLSGLWRGKTIVALTGSDLISSERSARLCHDISTAFGVPCVAVSSKVKGGVAPLEDALPHALPARLDKETLWRIISREINKEKPKEGKADRVLLHPFWGRIILLLILAGILFLSFGKPTIMLCDLVQKYILSPVGDMIFRIPIPERLSDFLHNGIFAGISSVILALPAVAITFLSVAFLESIGYLPRASALTDKMMWRAGLSGDSFIPILLGLGCTVPAVMCTRTISDKRERCQCCRLLPFISCSARVAVYSAVCREFFPSAGWILCLCMYLLTFAFFFLWSALFSHGRAGSANNRAVPPLRSPDCGAIISEAYLRTRDFILRAGGVIIITCVLISLLDSVHVGEKTLLEFLSGVPSVLLSPLGFGNTRAVSALIAGIGSKESIVSVLASTSQGGNPMQGFDAASSLSFAVFTALYCPCAATLSCIRKEQGAAEAFRSMATCFVSAYVCAFVVYRIALLTPAIAALTSSFSVPF